MISFQMIKKFKIRYQLLFIYSSTFVVIMALSSLVIYSIVKTTVESHIESELKNSTSAILNSVRTAVSVSIKNHMRATAENNYEIIQRLDERHKDGEFSIEEAQNRAVDIVMCQKIGEKGYICILDGSGRVLKHPRKSLEGLDISDHEFVRQMISRKNGYIEYYWQNPEEDAPKPKALYIAYFEPWDWLITVSSYQQEFEKLVNISDFRESILSHRFGNTGYSYVMDMKGNVIIHPELEGINVFRDEGFSPFFYKQMLEKKNGKLIYFWKNPSDSHFRKKLVIFHDIPEYEWMVASSSYLDEFQMPLDTIRNMIIVIGVVSLILFVPITFLLSATITSPLRELMNRFDRAISGRFTERLTITPIQEDETGQLARYYNSFMDKLEKYHHSLQAEIRERKIAQEALELSEEKYRSVMEAVPDPIVVYDMEGRVTYMNPAFTAVFGYSFDDCAGHKMDHFVPREHWKETMDGIEIILKGNTLPRTESRRKTKSGKLIDVTIRGSVYRNRDGEPVGSVITLRDVSEVRSLEKSIMEIGERERQKIGNDLHDDLCPHLIGIEGLASVMKKRVQQSSAESAALADQIIELIKEGISKTRRLARGLCPAYFNHGLVSSLKELVINTRLLYGIECTLECRCSIDIHHQIVVINLYHIAGEAVQNAIRHGRAENVKITVDVDEENHENLQISISDDGRGIDFANSDTALSPEYKEESSWAAHDHVKDEKKSHGDLNQLFKYDEDFVDLSRKGAGMGIRIMKYRANLLGGAFSIQPGESEGTCVVISLPQDGEVL
ncbi:exported hypothetical protein [Desulfamplus magnetovallimortis]|uniref:Oxygen sensor histidine kinase NreB n=1 Tax=Desulfamplus magnetovallimortis TaxID=1246637 RepID=A0A1W1HI84_9BACT|nr:cache domain-containing protein [Desulfamplus magnetovallimortis]SLM32092.1 exported hypothetical protein [Desulfamplus magnetovallimortis]